MHRRRESLQIQSRPGVKHKHKHPRIHQQQPLLQQQLLNRSRILAVGSPVNGMKVVHQRVGRRATVDLKVPHTIKEPMTNDTPNLAAGHRRKTRNREGATTLALAITRRAQGIHNVVGLIHLIGLVLEVRAKDIMLPAVVTTSSMVVVEPMRMMVATRIQGLVGRLSAKDHTTDPHHMKATATTNDMAAAGSIMTITTAVPGEWLLLVAKAIISHTHLFTMLSARRLLARQKPLLRRPRSNEVAVRAV